ncbi:MAG TPA: CPXCG motif-containing cysteine-rich protein [Steroidobacteraceae bacterium]|nr:CPXCG motif-containing cysteine-rich protein [Steroidobacteraceae bacterium]
MNPPKKTSTASPMSDAEIDALYGLEPAIGEEPAEVDPASRPEFVSVACPYCGEQFETSADASAGPCKYVEDCQVCCQPIDMEVRVDENGEFQELLARRGDAE